MRLSVKIDGDLTRMMADEVQAGKRAVSAGMRTAGAWLKQDWRREIIGAGLGQRLARAIRHEVYPSGKPSLNAAALVWSKAPEITHAHDSGGVIRSSDGFWLAIPTEAAGKGLRGGRITPGEWEQRHGIRLRFVFRPGNTGLLVADDARVTKGGLARRKRGRRRKKDGILTGAQTVVVFVLVPQVTLQKRLDLAASARAAHAMLPGAIIAKWRGAAGR